MHNAIEPWSNRCGIFQFPKATKGANPNFLEDVESGILTSCQFPGVIEEWWLHDRDQVGICSGFTGATP